MNDEARNKILFLTRLEQFNNGYVKWKGMRVEVGLVNFPAG